MYPYDTDLFVFPLPRAYATCYPPPAPGLRQKAKKPKGQTEKAKIIRPKRTEDQTENAKINAKITKGQMDIRPKTIK